MRRPRLWRPLSWVRCGGPRRAAAGGRSGHRARRAAHAVAPRGHHGAARAAVALQRTPHAAGGVRWRGHDPGEQPDPAPRGGSLAMTGIKLYELTEARDILDLFLAEEEGVETPEIAALFAELAGDIDGKVERTALWIKEKDAESAALKAEEQRLA